MSSESSSKLPTEPDQDIIKSNRIIDSETKRFLRDTEFAIAAVMYVRYSMTHKGFPTQTMRSMVEKGQFSWWER